MLAIYFDTVLQIGLIYSFVAIATCISFRFLSFPDLTPDGTFVLGAATAAQMLISGMPWPWTLLVAFLCGALFGTVTAILHRLFGLNKFFAGILVAMALYSINLRIIGGANISIYRLPTIFGTDRDDLSIVLTCVISLVSVIIAIVALFHTRVGLRIRGVASNPLGLRIPSRAITLATALCLALANGIAALGGAMFSQLQSFADVNMGVGISVVGFASLFLGEAVLALLVGPSTSPPVVASTILARPVVGEVFCAVAGAIFLTAISTSTLYLGLPPSDLKLVSAVILVAALVLRGHRSTTWMAMPSKFEI
jgi:putative ABC transport system permease protein